MDSADANRSRRSFLRNAGLGTLAFWVNGCEVEMTPEEARVADLEYVVLTEREVKALDALGNVLVPGSVAAGLSHFVDQQLGETGGGRLLMIRYLGVPPPYAGFYQSGLAALDAVSMAMHDAPFAALDGDRQVAIAGLILQTDPDGWEGPSAPFFTFVLRADAVDVLYGTKAGFAMLDVPYMAHIGPPDGWTD